MTGLKDPSSSIWMWHRESGDGGESWRIHQALEMREDREDADEACLRRIRKRTSSFRFLSIRPTLSAELAEPERDVPSERLRDDERADPAIHDSGAGDRRGRALCAG
jgi:hypothetical protein